MMQVRNVGVAWYRRRDWKRLLQIFTDSGQLHATYDEWLEAAEKSEWNIKARGYVVERVYIDPAEFPVWCAAQGLEPDAAARSRFASEAVARKYGDRS